jgi:hypothetical protein
VSGTAESAAAKHNNHTTQHRGHEHLATAAKSRDAKKGTTSPEVSSDDDYLSADQMIPLKGDMQQADRIT